MPKNTGKKVWGSILIILTFLMIFAGLPQSKMREQTSTFSFEDLNILLSDDSFKGINAVHEYGFVYPSTWEPQTGSELNLIFSHARALSEKSSFVVNFNGSQVASVELNAGNSDHGELSVQIPRELWVDGYNRIQLVFHLGFEGFDCMNLDDDLLWFTVHTTSNFDLVHQDRKAEPLLNEFPIPFVLDSGIVENDVTFVLPDMPTSAETNAAALVSAKLGQFASWRTLNINFASQSDALSNPAALKGNVILVGQASHLSLLSDLNAPWKIVNGSLQDTKGVSYAGEAGILWTGQYPDNEHQSVLVVTGNTEASLLKAAQALTMDSVIEQLPDNLAVLNQVPASISSQATYTSTFTLADYQYLDTTSWGTTEQRIAYTLPLATSWKVQDDVTLRLHFAHSDFGELNESFITILMNGTPADTIQLTADNAEDAWQEIIIPARLFDFGDNVLTVVSNINLPDGYRDARYDCLDVDPTSSWIVVFADTELTVPLGPSGDVLSINEFPYAFIGNSDLSDFGFILPDSTDKNIDEMVIRLSGFLGHYLNGNGIGLQVFTPAEYAKLVEKPTHLFMIGQPTTNSKIAELNKQLPQPFEEGTNNPTALNDMVQVDPNFADIGYLQALLDSDGNPMLIATGTSDKGIGWAVDALMDTTNIKNLYGDLALTRAEGSISSAMIQNTADLVPKVEESPAVQQQKADTLPIWIGIGFGALAVILVAIKIVEELLKNRKPRKHEK